MPIQEQRPRNRTTATIVIVALLCGTGFAYNNGWFNKWHKDSDKIESNKLHTDKPSETKTAVEAAAVKSQATQPAATLSK